MKTIDIKSVLPNNSNIVKGVKKGVLSALAISLLITSCKEEPENNFTEIPPKKGTISADMGSPLSKSIYVDLSTGETTEANVSSWDFAFESEGKIVLINTGKKASILNTGSTDFASVTSTSESDYSNKFTFEQTNGDLTATALGDWTDGNDNSKNEVYILNIGTDNQGNALGFKKLVINKYSSGTSFEIKYADMDGSNEQTKTVTISSSENFTYFSLSTGSTVTVEPEKSKWDVVFTPISVPTGPPFAPVYRLAGSAQTNSYEKVGVSIDDPWYSLPQDDDPESERNKKDKSASNYDDFTKDNYASPSEDADAIGRNWMQILKPHSSGNYKVYEFMTYILKDASGNYFKLRFTAYKNPNTGENGTAQFEYQELK